MGLSRQLEIKRCYIILCFRRFGFRGRTAFYNVCKSIDTTLNGLDIVQFYDFDFVSENMVIKMEAVLQKLKTE